MLHLGQENRECIFKSNNLPRRNIKMKWLIVKSKRGQMLHSSSTSKSYSDTQISVTLFLEFPVTPKNSTLEPVSVSLFRGSLSCDS